MATSLGHPKLAELSSLPPLDNEATNANRPSHLEAYGVHCTEPTCNLSDFLPFKCGYCKASFCASHRLPFAHTCTVYDEKEADVRVSLCQWCEGPLRVDKLQGRDTDINEAMEYHISSGACPVLKDVGPDGLFKTDQKSGKLGIKAAQQNDHKKCNFWKCKNIMWVEMRCKSCGKGFCPTHREARSHRCGELQGSGGNNSESSSRSATPLASSGAGQGTGKTVAAQSTTSSRSPFSSNSIKAKLACVGNTNATAGNTSQSTSGPPQGPFAKLSLSSSSSKSPNATSTGSLAADSSSTSSKPPNANKLLTSIKGKTTSNVADMSVSRRAAREREQAALSLQNRAKKGLLSEDEKVRYATLKAMEARSGSGSTTTTGKSKDGKDCCIS